jgi:hypothetical protein
MSHLSGISTIMPERQRLETKLAKTSSVNLSAFGASSFAFIFANYDMTAEFKPTLKPCFGLYTVKMQTSVVSTFQGVLSGFTIPLNSKVTVQICTCRKRLLFSPFQGRNSGVTLPFD